MTEDLFLIMVEDDGVFGVAKLTPYGCDAILYTEGIEYVKQLETDEFTTLARLEDVDENLFSFFE